MLYTKSKWIFCRKLDIYVNRLMLKVPCLAFKCSFHRQETNAKGGPYRIESWRSENAMWNEIYQYTNDPVDTGGKLNVHKTFRRRPGRLLNVLCTFNLPPVSTGEWSSKTRWMKWSHLSSYPINFKSYGH